VIYNERIAIRDIPLEAYKYVVNGKPAMERQGRDYRQRRRHREQRQPLRHNRKLGDDENRERATGSPIGLTASPL
jgi:hypothetical protein